MLDEERWLPIDALRRERNGYRDEKVAVCGSLLLHALLLLVLSGNSNFIPSLGGETRIDVLWLSVSPRASAPPPEADIAPAPRATASRHPAAPPASHPASAARRQEADADPGPMTVAAAATRRPAEPAPVTSRRTAPAALPAPPTSSSSTAHTAPPPPPTLPAPAVATAPPEPPVQPAAIASLMGDLKVTVAGEAMRVTVLFRPFPKSRRSVEPTRAETRRLTSVTPVCADAPNRSREAVVERAGEGVYVFMVEPEHGERAQASFTLKIYESGAAEKVKVLGKRVVSGKSVLARVLMPEGILWDDEEAFTGSIQDMDSTTKFNARTGLSWKEFDESTSESPLP